MSALAAPTVSVCIPTYRGDKHLGAAIDSVIAQTYRDFELLVIDDNSPDETLALIARYSDPRIRYMRNSSNLGPENNWNKCLAEARGKYIKLLPHDDMIMPECLERQVTVLEQDAREHLALVFCARQIVGPRGQTITVRGYPRGKRGAILAKNLVKNCLRYGTNLVGEPGGVLFRRKLSQHIGLFDSTQPYVIDLDYWFRLALHGDAYYIPEPLASFRVWTDAWSFKIGRRQSIDFCNFIDRISRSKNYSLNSADVAVGKFMARLNNIARLVFYRFVLKSG